MMAWLLLLLTIGACYLTYDAFRWRDSVECAPFSVIADLWRGGLAHLTIAEQNQLKRHYVSRLIGIGQLCWLFLGATIVLAVLTIQAFIE
jgi:hypothetical protein